MHDLEKFGFGLISQWVLENKTYKDMWTRTKLTSGPDKGNTVGFGLGWDVGTSSVSKLGGGWGWTTFFEFYPKSGDSVILLCNADANGIGNVAKRIHKAVAGE